MTTTDTMELLSALHYVYSVFQRIMGDVPTLELFNAIDVPLLSEAFEIVGVSASDVQPFLDMLADPALDVDTLARDYARIFVGPSALPAPPWESVYRDRKRVVMTATTLAVRDAYRAQGFIPARYPHVPDDHLALELDFMAALAGEALQAAQAEDMPVENDASGVVGSDAQGDVDGSRCRELVSVANRFCADHLGVWVADFARDVSERDGSAFYSAAAWALAAFVAADKAVSAKI